MKRKEKKRNSRLTRLHSLRRPKPHPLRLHPAALPHLVPPVLLLLRHPRLPRHRPPPRPRHPHPLRLQNQVPDPVAKRPLPGERVRQVCEPVGVVGRGGVCGAGARDAGVRAGRGLVLVGELGGAECGGGERGEGFGGCCQGVKGL